MDGPCVSGGCSQNAALFKSVSVFWPLNGVPPLYAISAQPYDPFFPVDCGYGEYVASSTLSTTCISGSADCTGGYLEGNAGNGYGSDYGLELDQYDGNCTDCGVCVTWDATSGAETIGPACQSPPTCSAGLCCYTGSTSGCGGTGGESGPQALLSSQITTTPRTSILSLLASVDLADLDWGQHVVFTPPIDPVTGYPTGSPAYNLVTVAPNLIWGPAGMGGISTNPSPPPQGSAMGWCEGGPFGGSSWPEFLALFNGIPIPTAGPAGVYFACKCAVQLGPTTNAILVDFNSNINMGCIPIGECKWTGSSIGPGATVVLEPSTTAYGQVLVWNDNCTGPCQFVASPWYFGGPFSVFDVSCCCSGSCEGGCLVPGSGSGCGCVGGDLPCQNT